MADYETIIYEESDGVAWITLNRPQVLNAFNATMIDELHDCWRALRVNESVRVAVLTGAGDKAFCTGVDRDGSIGVYSPPFHYSDPGEKISPKTGADLWKPVIGAINGMACGGAFYMLAEADFMVASESASFFDPHTTYGMPSVFESMAMLQRMPLGEVLRMGLLGSHERMSAARAHQIGLVQEVVAPDQLRTRVHELARKIASQPARAVQATVRAVWYARELGYRQALDVAKTLVQFGVDDEALAEGQRLFESGGRIPWELR